jgi:sensor domain CHASE-containing protein
MTAPQKTVLSLKREPRNEAEAALEERLHKVLANAGLGSRRMLELRIQSGEVELNGKPAEIGTSVQPVTASSSTASSSSWPPTIATRLKCWSITSPKACSPPVTIPKAAPRYSNSCRV